MSKQCLIIAEAGVNHNGSIERACELIDAAAKAGASVVKFQSFRSSELVSPMAAKAEYQKVATGSEETQFDMLRKLELSEEDHHRIFRHAQQRGLEFLSTPFDLPSLRLLTDKIGLRKIKIPSGEITNAPLLLEIARAHCEVIVSTGASTLSEIEEALGVLAFGYTKTSEPTGVEDFEAAFASPEGQAALKERVKLLQCTSEYPAPVQEVNLCAIDTLAEKFGLPTGLSDHTTGIHVAIAAVARGASIIEKHFTLDRNLPGPDHRASIEPNELGEMIRAIRDVELALGDGEKKPSAAENKNRGVIRKSLVLAKPLQPGEVITPDHLATRRPAEGISPMQYWKILGRKAARAYAVGEALDE